MKVDHNLAFILFDKKISFSARVCIDKVGSPRGNTNVALSSASLLKGGDGTAIAVDGIIPAKQVSHNQGRSEGDDVFPRALFIGESGGPTLRPIGPVQVVQQLGPFFLREPVRLEAVRFVEDERVSHHELLEAA